MTLKQQFMMEIERSKEKFGELTQLMVAIQLPTGAREVIINTTNIDSKIAYYDKAYNDDLELNNNNEVKIVGILAI